MIHTAWNDYWWYGLIFSIHPLAKLILFLKSHTEDDSAVLLLKTNLSPPLSQLMPRTMKIMFPSTSVPASVTNRLCASSCRATLMHSRTLSTSTGTHRYTCKWFAVSVAFYKFLVGDLQCCIECCVSSGPAITENLRQWRSLYSCLVQKVCQRRTYSARQYFTGIVSHTVFIICRTETQINRHSLLHVEIWINL